MDLECGDIKVPNGKGSREGSTSRSRGAISPGRRVYRRAGGCLPVYAAWTDARPAGAVLAVDDVDPVRLQCKMCVSELPGGVVRYHELRFVTPEDLEWYLDHAERCAPADRHHRCTCCLEWIYGCAAHVLIIARLRSHHRACGVAPPARRHVAPCPDRQQTHTPTRLMLTVAVCNRSDAQRCGTCSQPMHPQCAAQCAVQQKESRLDPCSPFVPPAPRPCSPAHPHPNPALTRWLERSPHCPVCRTEWRSGDKAEPTATALVPGATRRKLFSPLRVRKLSRPLTMPSLTVPRLARRATSLAAE